jgi:hypothetical protein
LISHSTSTSISIFSFISHLYLFYYLYSHMYILSISNYISINYNEEKLGRSFSILFEQLVYYRMPN